MIYRNLTSEKAKKKLEQLGLDKVTARRYSGLAEMTGRFYCGTVKGKSILLRKGTADDSYQIEVDE